MNREPWFHKLLKKLFKLEKTITIEELNFTIETATPGPIFRRCAVVYGPSAQPPFGEHNWYSRICAVVFFGHKVLSFSARNKVRAS